MGFVKLEKYQQEDGEEGREEIQRIATCDLRFKWLEVQTRKPWRSMMNE